MPLEGLILAQSERWRRGLGMQVERFLLLKYIEIFGSICTDLIEIAANG